MTATTHEGVRDARLTPPCPSPTALRASGERAFRAARVTLACILLGTIAIGAIIAVRLALYALGHPDQPLHRLFSQLWS